MALVFVRHGESEANLLHEFSNRGFKHGLTDNGRQQAEALARTLQGRPVIRLYSSPLMRAVQTAEILGGVLGLPHIVTDALREYDCGILEGRADEAAWAIYRDVLSDWLLHRRWDRRIEQGESFHDIQARFVLFIERLVQAHRQTPGDSVLVGHGGTYRCMLPLVLANITFEFAIAHGIGNTVPIVAEIRPEGLVCVAWGDMMLA
ncbi:MAG: histidine phosphatase family protein [Anaerolineae bacterium]|nr:histidine phosphatase family protein [Anaerolineae bacterium]